MSNRKYLSGPISGLYPQEAASSFSNAEQLLTKKLPGFVFNPHAFFHDFTRNEKEFGFDRFFTEKTIHKATWNDFLSACFFILVHGDFDEIIMLPGWENSKGARLEMVIAKSLNIRVSLLEIEQKTFHLTEVKGVVFSPHSESFEIIVGENE